FWRCLIRNIGRRSAMLYTKYKIIKTQNQYPKDMLVILIHGLLRTGRSMRRLGKFLTKHSYDICIYDYPSSRFKIKEHAEHLNIFLEKLLSEESYQHIAFVTHSMGGIIAREAISMLDQPERKRITKLVMLAAPTKGSHYAERVLSLLP